MTDDKQTSLLDDLGADQAVRGPTCTVRRLLDELDAAHPDVSKALRTAMDEPKEVYTHTSIVRWIARHTSRRVQSGAIARHRNGLCRCDFE